MAAHAEGGKARADYGTGLLKGLSRVLSLVHGKGFSRSNVTRRVQFYFAYQKCAKASPILSWSPSLCVSASLREIDSEFVSRKALAAGYSFSVTDRIVTMIGGLHASRTAKGR